MGLIIGTKSGSGGGSISLDKLKELFETLPDGQAVSAQVALNTLQLQGLKGLSLSSYENGDFAIADEQGNILVKFADGHIQTKNFDSSEIKSQQVGVGRFPQNGLPMDLPKVYITSALLTPNTTNNTIAPLTYDSTTWEAGAPVGSTETNDVQLEFKSSDISFVDNISINYQGHTSLADVKKAFAIDMAHKHRFGKWIDTDSFHLKAFYEDFIGCRDWVCNQLMEQIYQSRSASERRPFMRYLSGVGAFFGGNSLCHVDGFPCEVYINGEYWGVYVWRLKKSVGNYRFDKTNTNHVFIDTQWLKSGFAWSGIEIKNPKADSGNTAFVDKVEPNDGEVKTIITAWKDFMWSITSQTPKASIEAHMDIKEFIDTYLLCLVCNCWDSWARNTLYGTWDGAHFAPMPYDMNNSFNGFGGKTGTYAPYYTPTSNTFNEKARSISWFVDLESIYSADIRARYKELKQIGIFTADNIIGLFDSWAEVVGSDAYAREAARWSNCPSLVGNNRDVDTIANIADWVSKRMLYLDNQYK